MSNPVNFNDNLPAAQILTKNVGWQLDPATGNVSAYVDEPIALATDAVSNPNQSNLNLQSGTGIQLTYVGGLNGTVNIASTVTGTVTNTSGALVNNELVFGDGANDIKVATGFGRGGGGNTLIVPALLVSDSPLSTTAGSVIQATSANATETAIILANTSSVPNSFGFLVTGSNSAIRGTAFFDLTVGSFYYYIYSTAANKPVISVPVSGVIGFTSTNDPSTNPVDTAISRTAANSLAVGNGTQGNASGTLHAANLHATSAASGSIALAALTVGGTQGSITVVDGIITAFVNAT